jgi:type IV secretion system protein VirB10
MNDGHLKNSAAGILSSPRRPIARYRPWVIALVLAGVLLLVAIGFLVGLRPKSPAVQQPGPPVEMDNGAAAAELDRRLPATYDDPLALRSTDQSEPSIAAAPAQSSASSPAGPPPEQVRGLEELRAANGSGPFFGGPVPAPSVPRHDMQMVPAPAPEFETRTAKERFIARTGAEQHLSPYLVTPPLSAFEIKAGTLISAALVTGLSSDLPGPVIAQVTEPVFDHVTGRRVLIPQGARLIGRYDSQVSHGQDRALVVWKRIIFPDGRSLSIGAMTGADATGAAGLADQVDAHLPNLMRAVGLSTLISIGGAAAQNSLARSSDNLILQDAAGGVSATASQTGQRLVERDLQRAPTLRVRPGWPLKIIVDKDILFAV